MGEGDRQRASANPMAQYFVQLREFERRLLREAFEVAGGNIERTADVLGVHKHYVKARAKLLGGVFESEPKHEPPGLAAKAWQATSPPGKTRKRGRPKREVAPVAALMEGAYIMDGPDGPVCSCGQPSTHESGWCGVCAG